MEQLAPEAASVRGVAAARVLEMVAVAGPNYTLLPKAEPKAARRKRLREEEAARAAGWHSPAALRAGDAVEVWWARLGGWFGGRVVESRRVRARGGAVVVETTLLYDNPDGSWSERNVIMRHRLDDFCVLSGALIAGPK